MTLFRPQNFILFLIAGAIVLFTGIILMGGNEHTIFLEGLFVWMFIVVIILLIIFPLGLVYFEARKRKYMPRYEEWKKKVVDMGFTEIDDKTVVGKYRDHDVTIDEIDIAGSQNTPDFRTRYTINFENKQKILLFIKRGSDFLHQGWGEKSSSGKNFQDIHLPDLEHWGFDVKGNKETEIKSILDSAICTRIVNLRKILWMEIGFIIYAFKPASAKSVPRKPVAETFNLIRYVDSQELYEIKGNIERFKTILDTLIDIVEKIEAY